MTGTILGLVFDRTHRPVATLACLLCCLCSAASNAGASGGVGGISTPSPLRDQQTIIVPIDKSRIVDLRETVARVSIANPAIADILVINPRQLYINGKELGTTNMILWDAGDRVQRQIGLEVTHDLQTLKEKLHRFLPGEGIRVESAQGAIVLSGEVSSPVKMDAALRLAESYATRVGSRRFGQGAQGGTQGGTQTGAQRNVINLLQVGGAQQVLLEVKVAEIQRALTRRFDVDLAGLYDGGSIKIGAVNGGATFPDVVLPDGTSPFTFPLRPGQDGLGSPFAPQFKPSDAAISDTGLFANFLSGNFYFNVVLDIAKTQGLAKILAEPNLTTLSGQQADFLSGGEFPVPVPDDQGNIAIEYKKFGIQLTFVPIVLDSGLISLKVNVSVSELSSETSIALTPSQSTAVTVVPSLRSRGANATVEVPSGQTIAIAGLLSETLREGLNKFPGLADVPIIGALFRSQEYQKGQTELVIFVTPRLARPFETDLVKLPTDDFVEPSDVEFYLMGRLEGRRPASKTAPKSTLGPDKSGSEGAFGHDL